MEYGKIHDKSLLDKVSWKLPALDPLSTSFLKQSPAIETKLHIGAPAWGHKEWVGKVYPPKTPATKYLYHYSRYFNTIELNTTHYRIPTTDQAEKWISQVPKEFIFCPKIFQGISHERTGLVDIELHKQWFKFLEDLKTHRGPCFLQMPPSFSYDWKFSLFKFLQAWPKEFKLAIELRHRSWFENGVIIPALTEYLQKQGIGLVITDVGGHREVLHSSVISDFTMIRFIGNELHESDYERASYWNERLNTWSQQGLSEVFFFVHQPDDTLVPEMTTYLQGLTFFESRFKNQLVSVFNDVGNEAILMSSAQQK